MIVNRYLSLLFLSLVACSPEKKSSAPELPSFTVSLDYPQEGKAQHYAEWVGQVASLQQVAILPQISGYVSERLFKNGQSVKKGDILYQIAPQLYQQALKEAEQLVAQKQAELDKAQQNLDYYAPLLKENAVSRQDYTNAKQLVSEANAALQAAQAAAQQARTNLGYCTLSSPISGVVGFAQSYVGAYVSPESAPLVTVTLLDPIRINFAISEQQWLQQNGTKGLLREGTKLDIILSDGQNYPMQATIKGVDSRVNTATGTLMLDSHVSNKEGLLRPGMYVTVRALVAEQANALWVPSSAIANMQGMNFVLSYSEEGKVSMIPVELGLIENNRVVIQGKGISTQTRIISNGTQQGMMAAAGRCTLHIADSR